MKNYLVLPLYILRKFTWLVMDTNFLVLCPIGLSVTIPSITASSTLAENRELGEPLRMYVPTDERDLIPLFCPSPDAVRFPWPDH